MSQQNQFQGGVNKKYTTSTASCAQAEKGEAGSPQKNFSKSTGKGRKPTPGPQKNFPNGS